jgi:hypothetical protein
MFYECDEQSVALRARLAAAIAANIGVCDDETDLEGLLLSPDKMGLPTLARLKVAAVTSAEGPGRSVDAAEFMRLIVDGGVACLDVRSPGEVHTPFCSV